MIQPNKLQISTVKAILKTVSTFYNKEDIKHKTENYNDNDIILTVEVLSDTFKRLYMITECGTPIVLDKR